MYLNKEDIIPLNGWGCKCKKIAYSKKQLEKKGWSVSEDTLKDIVDKDFAYDIREGSKVVKLSKIDLDKTLNTLPKATKNKHYEELSDSELLSTFYNKLEVSKRDISTI